MLTRKEFLLYLSNAVFVPVVSKIEIYGSNYQNIWLYSN